MTSVALLLPLALAMGLLGLGAFFWALKRGQFEDLDGAANRILIDEDETIAPVPAPPIDRAGSDVDGEYGTAGSGTVGSRRTR